MLSLALLPGYVEPGESGLRRSRRVRLVTTASFKSWCLAEGVSLFDF